MVVVNWSQYVVYFIELISDYNVTRSVVEAPVAWSSELNMFYHTGQIMNLPAIGITVVVTLLLISGIYETAFINLLFVIIKMIILLIFIFACCAYVDRKNYVPFFPSNQGMMIESIYDTIDKIFYFIGSFGQYGFTGMLHASTIVLFAYVGFESATTVAQEAKQASRTMPLVLIGSLVISLLIYVGVCTVMVGLVPYQALNTPYPLITAA